MMTQRLCHKCNQVPLIIGLSFGEMPLLELCGDCLKQFVQDVDAFYLEAEVKVFGNDDVVDKLRAAIESIWGGRKLALGARPSGTA